jgi:hypothetical protein
VVDRIDPGPVRAVDEVKMVPPLESFAKEEAADDDDDDEGGGCLGAIYSAFLPVTAQSFGLGSANHEEIGKERRRLRKGTERRGSQNL